MMVGWLVTAAVTTGWAGGICWPARAAAEAAGGEGSIQARIELEMV